MNPLESTATFKTWRDQAKAYIMVLAWNPGYLIGEQQDSVQNFARCLPAIKRQVTKVKTDNHREDVEEDLRKIRFLVKDTAKKLQATNNHLHVERPDDTAERSDDTTAAMASDIMSKFEYPTSHRPV